MAAGAAMLPQAMPQLRHAQLWVTSLNSKSGKFILIENM